MKKRPAQDESVFTPYLRKLYGRTVLGRPGDSKEEAVKYTQTLSEKLHADSQTEWISRLHEYTYGCETILKDAMENEVTPEAQEEATKELTFGAYAPGVFPAVPVIPVKMVPTMLNQVYGPSADVCWVNLDEFTMESQWVSGWHFEKGVQSMNNLWFLDDDWKLMLDRRHMRTGEKFKQLCVQRTFIDGATMASDVLKDIRNEKDPEHSDSPLYFHGIVNNTTVDAQYGSRNGFELVHLMNAYITSKIGFPYQTYNCFLPMPNMYDLLLQLPVESVPPQIMGLYMGTDKWVSCYTLSHLETLHEVFGEEMIPPTPAESINSSIKYGDDIFKYPESFKQSKYLYGQEAMCRTPTEYPCAQKAIPTIMDATAEIETARKEHSDWLAQ